jgi:hypothetical protein
MRQILQLALILGSAASVFAHPRFVRPQMIEIRQATTTSPAPTASEQPAGPASGNVGQGSLTDVDILQLYVLAI